MQLSFLVCTILYPQAENARANKRITETTKRTQDIVANKTRDALIHEEKEAAKKAAEDEQRRMTQAHFIARSQAKATRNVSTGQPDMTRAPCQPLHPSPLRCPFTCAVKSFIR